MNVSYEDTPLYVLEIMQKKPHWKVDKANPAIVASDIMHCTDQQWLRVIGVRQFPYLCEIR
jgi:hypothetical protein